MKPRERQAIISAMAARSGSELETFFRSHGLAHAYRRRSGSSKEQRINDALDAGEAADGSTDQLLTEAVRAFGLDRTKAKRDPVPVSPVEDSSQMLTLARTDRLHPKIREVSAQYVLDGYMAAAVFEAFKAVENRVKKMSKLKLIGQDLMAQAFGGNQPLIAVNEGTGGSDNDEQEGFRFIFMGAARGVRNPKAHEPFDNLDTERGFDYLAFAGLLMRRLDDAEEISRTGGRSKTDV